MEIAEVLVEPVEESSDHDPDQTAVDELLIEDVSIDGMCGVY
jgi:mycofactocin precursor